MRRAVAVLLVAAACSRGGGKEAGDKDLLRPKFQPDPGSVGLGDAGGSSTTASTTAGGSPSASSTTAPATGTTPGSAPAPVVPGATTAAMTDRSGDLTVSVDPPPAWADLVGGTLLRRADGFELRVRLGGGAAPTTTDEDHTMNVASFYDVDGDGNVDFEVWANLAARGWGASYFDNVGDRGGFLDKSGVTVSVEGAEVVLRFPLSHLAHAERFRWSLASEWGRYEVLGTAATARDDAPDDDGAARFPG